MAFDEGRRLLDDESIVKASVEPRIVALDDAVETVTIEATGTVFSTVGLSDDEIREMESGR